MVVMNVCNMILQEFSGRIYATGNPQACFELGSGAAEMTLRIPIGTECGTVQSVSSVHSTVDTVV